MASGYGPSHPKRRRSQSTHPNMSQKLNLVLCGSNKALKGSISDLILGPRQHSPGSSLECVRRDGVVCGRSITLVEIPALYSTSRSEEEVRQEALNCVSLCDPSGVHAFLLIIPFGPPTDVDKEELEKIQNVFSSKVNNYLIVVLTIQRTISRTQKRHIEQDTDLKNFLAICNHRHILVDTYGQTSKELLDNIEKRRKKQAYSLHIYMKTQKERVSELREEPKEEVSRKKKEKQMLKRKLQLEEGRSEGLIQRMAGGTEHDDIGEEEEPQDPNCLRVVLIGKTGNGKSATGNTILGREAFSTEASMNSVTRFCEKAVGEVQGKSVAVVDTPGLFDTTLSHEEVQEEIVKCISLSAPGPHAIIIVLTVGRITKEELDTLDRIKMIFGPKAVMFSIVLFTRGDDLGNRTIHQYIEKSNNEQINKLLRDCGNRYLVFNNREKEDRSQVSELLRQIDTMVNSNMPSPYFTNSMFEEAETSIKKKYEEILKEKEREIQAEKEKLENKYKKEMEEMKKRLEDEKFQMEKKFREKIENFKKEFEVKDELEMKKKRMENKKGSEDEKIQMEEWQNRIKELERENKQQKVQYEKQSSVRKVEDKKREERYKQEKENLRNQQKHAMEELRQRQEEELRRREVEEDRRRQEEQNERQNWERKIKEAEHERKEIQVLKRKQREWEKEKKREMKKMEIEDRRRRQRHADELRTKEEEQNRLREELERKMEKERRCREEEKRQWREAERKESERKEKEYEEKRRAMKTQIKEQREEWERRKREDDERREEERQRYQKRIMEIERERQEEIKRREKEEKECEKIKKSCDQKIREMVKRYEDEARQQAEKFNKFNERKEEKFQQLIKDHQKQCEHLENLVNNAVKKGEEVKRLQEELNKLKKPSNCVIQ